MSASETHRPSGAQPDAERPDTPRGSSVQPGAGMAPPDVPAQDAQMQTRPLDIVAVSVAPRSWRGDLRAIKIVWQRELLRFTQDRLRIVTQLVQPFL